MDNEDIATKWLNMNNPVRSKGLNCARQQNPERVQSLNIEPFQGSIHASDLVLRFHRRLFIFKPFGLN